MTPEDATEFEKQFHMAANENFTEVSHALWYFILENRLTLVNNAAIHEQQDVPKDCPCSAICLHVHPWQCRTNRICNVPSCVCSRLRSMRRCHGRNLFCAMLLYLSTRLCRRIAGSNSLRKKTNVICLHAKFFGQFKLERGLVFSPDVGFEWGLRVIWLDWWHRSRRWTKIKCSGLKFACCLTCIKLTLRDTRYAYSDIRHHRTATHC